MNTLLLIDVATSGFDPKKDVLLEIALLLVSADPALEVVESESWIVAHPGGLHPSLPEFHRANGLQGLCESVAGMSLTRIEAALLSGPWARASRLVGRGPDFERKFMSTHMPTFARQLPAATLDLNQVEYFATVVGGVSTVPRCEPRTYRAEDDLVESYEALRYYQAHISPGGN